MCGRLTLTEDLSSIELEFEALSESGLEVETNRTRYNIAPTQAVPIVAYSGGVRSIRMMRWGLMPRWSQGLLSSQLMINARLETAAVKSSFREAFQKRRCIVPATGFFEWKKRGSMRIPYRFFVSERPLFGMAGIWESFQNEAGEMTETFAILTTEANSMMRPIHDRMPVILNKSDYLPWLASGGATLLRARSIRLGYYPVSSMVNSAKNDRPECIERYPESAELL